MKFLTMAVTIGLISTINAAVATDLGNATVSTTSANSSDQNFQWTLEKMLMATAMPMTGEERTFLQTHKNLDGLRSWTEDDFKNYNSSPLGKKHLAEEQAHWNSVAQMLRQQAKTGGAFMHEEVPDYPDCPNSQNPNHKAQLPSETFEQMKALRQQIAILAPFVESLRKKAEAKGCSQEFENAVQKESNL